MQLFVRSTQTYTLDVTDSSTVEDVKNLVNAKEGFPFHELNIYYGGRPLASDDQLCRLENMSTLDVQVRILGGKIHGSINHAGKVKRLTDCLNVEKQEKRKSKTGRAKRRLQYNRRFVDVVPTFGKKRGPNANS